MKDRDFYTPTMAKIFIQQGYLGKAVEIYRYLVKQNPGQKKYRETLSEIEKRLSEKGKRNPSQLVSLMGQWIDLELKYQRLKKLKKLRKAAES